MILNIMILMMVVLLVVFAINLFKRISNSKKITNTYREELVNSILEYENNLEIYCNQCKINKEPISRRYVKQEQEYINFLRTELKYYDENKKN